MVSIYTHFREKKGNLSTDTDAEHIYICCMLFGASSARGWELQPQDEAHGTQGMPAPCQQLPQVPTAPFSKSLVSTPPHTQSAQQQT